MDWAIQRPVWGWVRAILSAEKKIAAALPEAMRNDIGQLRRRFHLDAPGWFNEAEQPVFLQTVFYAAWHKRWLRIGESISPVTGRRTLSGATGRLDEEMHAIVAHVWGSQRRE